MSIISFQIAIKEAGLNRKGRHSDNLEIRTGR